MFPFGKKKAFKDRQLKLTMGSVRRYKEVTGKDFMKGFNAADLTMDDIVALVWCLLVWEDPKLKLKDVEFMLDRENIDDISARINDALNPPKLPT